MDPKKSFIILIFLYLLTFAHSAKKSRYSLFWKNFECQPNPTFLTNCLCVIDPKDSFTLNVDLTLIKSIEKLWVTISINIPRPLNNEYIVLLKSDFDACQFIRNGTDNKLILYIYESLIKESNQPKACPLPSGRIYYRNISVLEHLPAFLPETAFSTNLRFYVPDESSVINVTLNGTIHENSKGRHAFTKLGF